MLFIGEVQGNVLRATFSMQSRSPTTSTNEYLLKPGRSLILLAPSSSLLLAPRQKLIFKSRGQYIPCNESSGGSKKYAFETKCMFSIYYHS